MEDTGGFNEFADSSYLEEVAYDVDNTQNDYAEEMEEGEEEEMREESMEDLSHVSEDE